MKKENNKKVIVGISCGDLNGIGIEVILKTFEDNRMLELCTPVLFANAKVASYIRKVLKMNLSMYAVDNIQDIENDKFNIYNVCKDGVNITFGTLSDEVGAYAVGSFTEAVKSLKNKEIDVLVTAPMHKYNIQTEGFHFPGHTGYLDEHLEGDALMLMVCDELKMGLLTDHVPLKDVSEKITKKLIQDKVAILENSLKIDFAIDKPKIAVLGLNPHSGDQGVIGEEEQEVLIPAIQELYDSGKLVFGPYSADAFFGSDNHKNFDAVLACYHDQGLIPFKIKSFGSGVNYTAGLNHIRTSPDHGTAFDIAGKGIANEGSFREAVYKALDIYKNRSIYQEYAKNPLKVDTKKVDNRE